VHISLAFSFVADTADAAYATATALTDFALLQDSLTIFFTVYTTDAIDTADDVDTVDSANAVTSGSAGIAISTYLPSATNTTA
jgi:hypothetical protein